MTEMEALEVRWIAIIDDDEYIGNMLQELLEREHYGVLRAYSGTEALLLLQRHTPDLILLDLMLPGLSGEQVLPEICGIPVIVMSAKGDVEDKVSLLLSGAVDYVTKPFDTRELLARIAVQLREAEAASKKGGSKGKGNGMAAGDGSRIQIRELILDTESRELWVFDQPVHLTRTEYAILKLLMEHNGRVLSRSTILDAISIETPDCTENTLKVHISNLRRKLREPSGKDYIEAIWGIGFRFRESP